MEELVGQASCDGEGKPVPLSRPFEIQVQGHEPREEWQRGPAPGQTGSHRTGPRSSSPRPCPPQPTPSGPRLTGVRQPTPSGQAGALYYRVPSPSLCWVGIGSSATPPTPREGGPRRDVEVLLVRPGLCVMAQRSPLLMITPTSPPGPSSFGACAGPHIPMATVAVPSTQCEWATSQVLPNWDEGETFWDNTQP